MVHIDENTLERLYLLEGAVSELAELNGHSSTKPISLSLFCLQHGLGIEERDKLILSMNRWLSENKDINFFSLREKINVLLPQTKLFSDEVLLGMIEIVKQTYVVSE